MSRPILGISLCVLLLFGCDRAADPVRPRAAADRAADAGVVVRPGGSIQAAIDAAAAGSVIRIAPGTYREALTIQTPDLTLLGLTGPEGEEGEGGEGGVVLENPDDADDGITVTVAGHGVVIRDVTVRGFEENGVLLVGVDGFTLSGITATDNGDYGLFPVFSSHGTIRNCRASGHRDTGIYIGQSRDVTLSGNVTFGNVNGIEVENASDIRVTANETYDNVAGILVVLLPGLDAKTAADIVVAGNRVHDNNHVNFGTPGELESFVPPGSGILVVGADRVTVQANAVGGNHFVGIGVGSSLLLGALAGLPPEAFADIEPDPDGARVLGNHASGNGGASPIPGLPAVDLFWDGSGTDNCWQGNTAASSYPSPLPACH
jgi:parallel beta-helix repeat protein